MSVNEYECVSDCFDWNSPKTVNSYNWLFASQCIIIYHIWLRTSLAQRRICGHLRMQIYIWKILCGGILGWGYLSFEDFADFSRCKWGRGNSYGMPYCNFWCCEDCVFGRLRLNRSGNGFWIFAGLSVAFSCSQLLISVFHKFTNIIYVYRRSDVETGV